MSEELKRCDEIWAQVPGFEGLYDISNKGRLRSWFAGGGYLLKTPYMKKLQKDKDGYLFALLYNKRKLKGFRISRLVLIAFCGEATGMEASHIDGNKDNCELDNLVWETRLDNERRKEQHGTRPKGEQVHFHRFVSEQILEMRKMRNEGKKLLEIANAFGTSQTLVSQVCRREIWKHI